MAMLNNQMVINMSVPIKGTRKVIEAWKPQLKIWTLHPAGLLHRLEEYPVPAVKEDTAQHYNLIQKPDRPMLYYNIL